MPSGIGMGNKKREGVTQETKREVAERDNYSCVICGNSDIIDIHHVYFKGHYNKSDVDDKFNLVTVCRDCHSAIHGGDKEKEKITKDLALERYSGENRERLLEIYKQRFSEEYEQGGS